VSGSSGTPSEKSVSTDKSSMTIGHETQAPNSDSLPEDSMLRELDSSPPKHSSAVVDMGSVSTSSIMDRRSNAATHRGSISHSKNTADLIRQHVQQQQKKSATRDLRNGLNGVDEDSSSKPHQS